MGRGEGFKSCLIFQEEKTLSLPVKPVTCTEEKAGPLVDF